MKFQTHRTVEIKLSNVPIKKPRINGYNSNRLYENQMVVVVFDRNSHKMFENFTIPTKYTSTHYVNIVFYVMCLYSDLTLQA